MKLNLSQKILKSHLVSGKLVPGEEIAIRIDQTLTQDSTGTMAYLQFEALGIPRVRTQKSVAYIDHNMLQSGPENADDHKYLQTVSSKYGIYFSRPGNGICHQVHLERFGKPGLTLLGSDSHTPTAGGLGVLAIGAGGLDVAIAMGGGAYHLIMPKICRIELIGKLNDWVSAKDIIIEVLRRLSVKGGVGKIMEYTGKGLESLTVPQRATITNMGAELGATTSIFPSDNMTRTYLKAQGREKDWKEQKPDDKAVYDEEISINLSELEPMAAKPYSPDNIAKISEIGKIKVDQVAIGSCTNSSYVDLMTVAQILKGRYVHPDVSLVISPGSKQVLTMISQNGGLSDLIAGGARILESACGPCIGMGQAPASGAVSLRTFNRNFLGRSGTKDSKVFIVSPEVAAVSALTGELTDPRTFGKITPVKVPAEFLTNDNMIISPEKETASIRVVRGPNIKPFPVNQPLPPKIRGKVLIKLGDNITTDHIMPSNARLLPYRSNIPYLAEFCLTPCDPDFPKNAKENNGGIIIGGENYGQGSSREHAALAPLQLGIKAVIAKSFARIHMANLINSGILPVTFENPTDYDSINTNDNLIVENTDKQIKNSKTITIKNQTSKKSFSVRNLLSPRQKDIILAGGLLNYTKKQSN